MLKAGQDSEHLFQRVVDKEGVRCGDDVAASLGQADMPIRAYAGYSGDAAGPFRNCGVEHFVEQRIGIHKGVHREPSSVGEPVAGGGDGARPFGIEGPRLRIGEGAGFLDTQQGDDVPRVIVIGTPIDPHPVGEAGQGLLPGRGPPAAGFVQHGIAPCAGRARIRSCGICG